MLCECATCKCTAELLLDRAATLEGDSTSDLQTGICCVTAMYLVILASAQLQWPALGDRVTL